MKYGIDPILLTQVRRIADMAPDGLRLLREDRRLSRADVERYTGLARTTIYSVETGRRPVPSTPAGMRYARFLLVPENLLRLDEFGLGDLATCVTQPQDFKSICAIWARGRNDMS
jgi:transcriptional regulator with XRE-family HTH domain